MLLAEHETIGYPHYLIIVLHVHAISAFQIAHLPMHSLDYFFPIIIHDDAVITKSTIKLGTENAVYLIIHLRKSEHGEKLRQCTADDECFRLKKDVAEKATGIGTRYRIEQYAQHHLGTQ